MSGLSGAGKSTVGRQLARLTNAIHLRSDAVRKHLAGIPLEQRGDEAGSFGSGIYTPEMSKKTYDQLLALGLFLAGQGLTVILDGKYDRQDLREKVVNQITAAGLPVKMVYCTAPEQVIRSRLQQRQGDIADATVAMMDEQLKIFENFNEAEQPYLTTIHTDQDVPMQLKSLL
jgi:predicted kinase